MNAFARLFAELDSSTSTRAKVDAMARYFAQADARDAAWAVYFLAGGKPRRVVPARALREFAVAASGLPAWLFEESYEAVGDLAETIALLLPPPSGSGSLGLAQWVEERLLPLRGMAPADLLARLGEYAGELDCGSRFLLIKLIGGGFRVGVSRLLVTRALAQCAALDPKLVAQRLIGYTDGEVAPTAAAYRALIAAPADPASNRPGGLPYPFFLAHPLNAPVARFGELLGSPSDWLIEWKYDGIRAQLVRRAGQTWLWSRGEELITERFPEIEQAARSIADGTVLDGEIVVWDEAAGHPGPFARLQTRTTRKRLTPKILAAAPVSFVAYDLIEHVGHDLRDVPQGERRRQLERLLDGVTQPRLSAAVQAASWEELAVRRQESRARAVEGLMLKHLQSRYGVGRTREAGTWWKWKIDPLSVDCVLVYAQAGHGRRASLYTDYTFAVWDRAPNDAAEAQQFVAAVAAGEAPAAVQARGLPVLVPFAKAYSGLTDAEIRQVDRAIRNGTIEKFGPVRSVVPVLVFELGFEGIQRSARHKSGIAVRFPRILRRRDDKPLHEADTLASLQALLGGSE